MAESPGAPLLIVDSLQAWYGESHILHGVTFDVPSGEVVMLLGRNGAGKTTTLKSIMGIVGKRSGSVRFKGNELIARMSNEIARMGIALCPEDAGWCVIDIDPGGEASWIEAITKEGGHEPTYEVGTPRGGRHLWEVHHSGVRSRHHARDPQVVRMVEEAVRRVRATETSVQP